MLLFTHVYKAALFSIDSDESAVAILGNTLKNTQAFSISYIFNSPLMET